MWFNHNLWLKYVPNIKNISVIIIANGLPLLATQGA